MKKHKGIMSFYVVLFCLVFFTTANQIRADTFEASQEYVIEWGDTLSQLAIDFDTETKTLVERNDIKDADLIYAGDRLNVKSSVKEIDAQLESKPCGQTITKENNNTSENKYSLNINLNNVTATSPYN